MTHRHPLPWMLRRNLFYLYIADANGDVVYINGRKNGPTSESERMMERLVELANKAPSIEAAIDALFDEILQGESK